MCNSLLQKQCPALRTVKYLQDGKPKLLPPSLTSQVTGSQTPTVNKDVRPKTKNRNSSTKQEAKDQNGTLDLPLRSALQQRAALATGDEAAYDIFQRCSQCGILLPLPVLNQHQVPSSPLDPAASSPGWEPAAQCLPRGGREWGIRGWKWGDGRWGWCTSVVAGQFLPCFFLLPCAHAHSLQHLLPGLCHFPVTGSPWRVELDLSCLCLQLYQAWTHGNDPRLWSE